MWNYNDTKSKCRMKFTGGKANVKSFFRVFAILFSIVCKEEFDPCGWQKLPSNVYAALCGHLLFYMQ